MLTFFTTVGLGASFRLVNLGGKLLAYILVAWVFRTCYSKPIGISFAEALT